MLRRLLAAFCVLLLFNIAHAAERWETLPATPTPITSAKTGRADVNGIKLYYSITGHGSPVVLLHGGLANSDYWGHQVKALSAKHTVITLDSRGHGRSSRDARPYGYDLMADDMIAVLDKLKIERADIVGWSDGAILGLDLAMRYPQRTGKVFAFAANTQTLGVKEGIEKNPTFATYIERAGKEYVKLSPSPKEYDAFVEQISHMWASQPNWTTEDLAKIKSPVLIVDGDHDEAIKREHTEYMASAIPGAGLLILPNVSHFAFIQDPEFFNASVQSFLDQK